MNWAAYESRLNDPEPGTSIHTPVKEAVVCAYCGKDIEGDSYEDKFCNEACAILEQIDVRAILQYAVRRALESGPQRLADSYQRALRDFSEGFAVAKQIITDSFHE